MAVYNFPVESSLLLSTVNIAVSSAKVATVLFSNFGRSLVYSRYNGVIMKWMKMRENGGLAKGCHWTQVK